MPIKTFPMDIVDAGAARAQGNRNALLEQRQANIGQQMAQRNALAPATQAQSNLKTDSDRTKLMIQTLSTTTDQPSWSAAKQQLIGQGMPGDAIPDQFDANIRDQIIGKVSGNKETFSDIAPIPGMPGYSGQRSDTGKYVNIQEIKNQRPFDDDPLAPWSKIQDPAKRDQARISFGTQVSKKVDKSISEAEQSQTTINDLDRFIQLNETNATGAGYSTPLLGSMAAGARSAFDPEFQEMKSISDKLTPAMRQGMPGAASDRDVAMFRGATVGIEKSPEANRNIAIGLKAALQNKIDKAQFLSNYVSEKQHDRGADKEWKNYLNENPIFDHKAAKGSYTPNADRMSYDEWKEGSLAFTAEKYGMTISEVRQKLAGR